MVELLEPPIELVRDLEVPADTAVVLVDCQARNQNHILRGDAVPVVAVISRRRWRGRPLRLPYRDVRPGVAASATIAASYPSGGEDRAAGQAGHGPAVCRPHRDTRVRDALLAVGSHGVQMANRAGQSQSTGRDEAPLGGVFGDLILALASTFTYEDVAFCLLPRASGAEIIGEVADLLVRGEGIWRVLCGAVVRDDLLVSVRTQHKQDDATELVRPDAGRPGGVGRASTPRGRPHFQRRSRRSPRSWKTSFATGGWMTAAWTGSVAPGSCRDGKSWRISDDAPPAIVRRAPAPIPQQRRSCSAQ